VEQWARSDPYHAAEVALAHPAGYATRLVLEAIGKEWALSDPKGALSFASSQNSAHGRELAGQVMRHWVEKDLKNASGWFAIANDQTRERLLPSFVEAWGKQDAPNALQWCLTNTEGGQQSDVINALVKGSIAQDPNAAAAMVVGLEASPMRTKAAVTFAESMLQKGWWPGLVHPGGERKAKPEALAWLGQLDSGARKEVISNISWSWAENDAQGFAEYLRTPDGQVADPKAMAAAASSLVRQQPLAAMEWASQAPPGARDRALSDTFGNWVRYQPDIAMDWLQKLPANDARREASYLGAVLDAVPQAAFQDSPQNSNLNVSSGAQNLAKLLVHDPSSARQALSKLPMSDNARAKAYALLRLNGPSKR